jgi:hypothetical protein
MERERWGAWLEFSRVQELARRIELAQRNARRFVEQAVGLLAAAVSLVAVVCCVVKHLTK